MNSFDAIIVGAGPAGLTAATYLARFRRRVLVLSDGPPRAGWIPESHNTPGFPGGIGGAELLERLGKQACDYGADIRVARVDSVARRGDLFEVSAAATTVAAPAVLLATGVVDRMPAIEGLAAAIRRSLVRMCPICDAYEAIDRRIAVMGDGGLAEREAGFLRTYSGDVEVIGEHSGSVEFTDRAVRWTAAGETREFDHLYLALGCQPQSALAVDCGARFDEDKTLIVDRHQMTTVEGLYSAGDVVRGLNQIAVAAGEAAIAATAIHNRLRRGAADQPAQLAEGTRV